VEEAMSELEMKQLASDVHLIATPFRWVADLIKLAIFFAILPLVIVGGIVYAAIYGGPIVDADMWFLLKILFTVLTPFLIAGIYSLCAKGSMGGIWFKELVVLVLCFVVIGALIKYQVITFDIDGQAPSFHAALPYHYNVVDGKAKMTCESLQDLRNDVVRSGGSTSAIDAQLANCR
jgi:hypothetical protein